MTTPKQSARGRKVPKGWRLVRRNEIMRIGDAWRDESPMLVINQGSVNVGVRFDGYGLLCRRIRPPASGKRGGGRK